MSAQRIVGLVLVIAGIVALIWGGVFWTNEKTVLDIGALEVKTSDRDGVRVPPVVGALALIGGVILLVIPSRQRA